MQENKKSKYILRVKGGLRLERQTIISLAIISIISLLLSLAMQYIAPMFFEISSLEIMHYEYLINVLLGIACSAAVSLLCLLIPYIKKKERQHTELTTLIKGVFGDYVKLLSVIDYNRDRDDNNNTYLGELHLLRVVNKLEEDSNVLISEYKKSDINSQNIQNVVDNVDTTLILTVQIVRKFMDLIMPEKHGKYSNDLFFLSKNEEYDTEKNKALYTQLRASLDDFMPAEKFLEIFSDYIDPNSAEYAESTNDTMEKLKNIKKHREQKRAFGVQNNLFLKIMKIQDMFYKKHAKKESENIEKEKEQCQQKRN